MRIKEPVYLLFKLNILIVNILCILLRIKKIFFLLKNRKNLKNNKKLFEYKTKEECSILGLGPSLKEQDINKLKGDIIVVNFFIKYNQILKPTFYLLLDDAFFSLYLDELKKIIEFYDKTIFILNGKYKDCIDPFILGEKKNRIFYIYGWKGVISKKDDLNFCKNLPLAMNVINRAVELGIYLKYKKIKLYGCDFNSFATYKPSHCYYEENEKAYPLFLELYDWSFAAYDHEILSYIAKKNKIEVFNLSLNSLIRNYPKKDKL